MSQTNLEYENTQVILDSIETDIENINNNLKIQSLKLEEINAKLNQFHQLK